MDIVNIPFQEKPLIIELYGQTVECYVFETKKHGNIKFGINAPITLSVHREEAHKKVNPLSQDRVASN